VKARGEAVLLGYRGARFDHLVNALDVPSARRSLESGEPVSSEANLSSGSVSFRLTGFLARRAD